MTNENPGFALPEVRLRDRQRGAALLESLFAVALISFGILGLVGLQATTVQAASDARYRAEASQLIDQLIGQIESSVARNGGAVDSASLAQFAHQTTINPDIPCDMSGPQSGSAVVGSWLTKVEDNSTLPRADRETVRIVVEPANGAAADPHNRVTVTLCWAPPETDISGQSGLKSMRNHTSVAYIN